MGRTDNQPKGRVCPRGGDGGSSTDRVLFCCSSCAASQAAAAVVVVLTSKKSALHPSPLRAIMPWAAPTTSQKDVSAHGSAAAGRVPRRRGYRRCCRHTVSGENLVIGIAKTGKSSLLAVPTIHHYFGDLERPSVGVAIYKIIFTKSQ